MQMFPRFVCCRQLALAPSLLLQSKLTKNRLPLRAGMLLAAAVLASMANSIGTPAKKVDFIHEVQPIFKESCYSCHGPEKSKAGLRLDTKARAMKGGENGVVIV